MVHHFFRYALVVQIVGAGDTSLVLWILNRPGFGLEGNRITSWDGCFRGELRSNSNIVWQAIWIYSGWNYHVFGFVTCKILKQHCRILQVYSFFLAPQPQFPGICNLQKRTCKWNCDLENFRSLLILSSPSQGEVSTPSAKKCLGRRQGGGRALGEHAIKRLVSSTCRGRKWRTWEAFLQHPLQLWVGCDRNWSQVNIHLLLPSSEEAEASLLQLFCTDVLFIAGYWNRHGSTAE